MTCRCGATGCPVPETMPTRLTSDEAAARAWEREVRDGPAIREAKAHAAVVAWSIEPIAALDRNPAARRTLAKDARQDMKDLLVRMKRLVGELDRLLERTK